MDDFSPEHTGQILLMGATFGLISALPLWLVFFSTRERPELMQQPQPSFRSGVRAAAGNRPFVFRNEN